MQHSIESLAENFSVFDDWEERYRYLIDLGRKLPPMPEDLKTDANLVRGCTSKVWMAADVRNGTLHFQADSDAHIVRGLIALLMAAYQDKPVATVAGLDIEGFFAQIGLDQHPPTG